MADITILDQTYRLPEVTSNRFQELQTQVREQQRLIHEGTRPRPPLLGVLPRPPLPVSLEERWQELEALVHNYEAILHELRSSKDAYQDFFTHLAADVRRFVSARNAESRQLEAERLAASARAVAAGNQAAQRAYADNGALLLHTVRLRGQATLLLLKKIALCQQGLTRLVEDQQVQQQVLQALVDDLDLQRQAYLQRRRIEQHLREAEEMAQVAQHFEAHLRDHLGPLQHLIEQVVQVDSSLHRTVEEIETLTRQMAAPQGLPVPGSAALDERLLDFLTRSQVKKERLLEVWEQWERDDGAAEALDMEIASAGPSPLSPVLTALDNLEVLVEARMTLSAATTPPQRRPRPTFDLPLVQIPAGTFTRGAATGPSNERPPHLVQIRRPFWIGATPVTQHQWQAIMGHNPSRFPGPEHPVEQVSWDELQEFLRRLNARMPGYRLPSEAEWEYAARAGATTAYSFGDDPQALAAHAWYSANAAGSTHPVRQKAPNAWGLYDMHGLVWEWVQDWEGPYPTGSVPDPSGPATGTQHLFRGGAWDSPASDCRLTRRRSGAPGYRYRNLGLRVVWVG